MLYAHLSIQSLMCLMAFSVFLFFHLLLEVVSLEKQKNILVSFSGMDINVKIIREYVLFHAFC